MRCNVAVSTLRYYERVGLLNSRERTRANYRVFGAEDVERVRFIRMTQSLGFTIRDIRMLLSLLDDQADSCQSVRGLIEKRLTAVDEDLTALRESRQSLLSLLQICKKSDPSTRCRALDGVRD